MSINYPVRKDSPSSDRAAVGAQKHVNSRHLGPKITHCPREQFLKSRTVHVITQGCDLCTLA